FMPVFGLNNGMVPIIAYNYGARHKDRMVHTMKLAVLTAVVMMLVGLCIMQLFPAQMLLLFEAEENMLAIGVPALKTLSLSFIFAGFCIVISSVFQALGFGIYSLLVSFVRQIIVLLPVAYLLSLSGDVNVVWWAFPIAEIATVLCCLLFLRRVNRKVLKPMETAVTA
ncbi:MAG TPA: MATE family efflux transporter, partial [Candidatus Avoscillospira avistercoris]|nr:MATE family efflux transporter [Candidatus Avoscillospira avistercoris]